MKKRKPALSLNPQNISEHEWYYEEPSGVNVVVELPKFGNTIQVVIPWRKMVKSVSRYLAVKQSKARHA